MARVFALDPALCVPQYVRSGCPHSHSPWHAPRLRSRTSTRCTPRSLPLTSVVCAPRALSAPRRTVHPCGRFVSSRTLASSLYLLVVRLFQRQYDDAFRLAEQCVTDSTLSAEESQLWDLLALSCDDTHPDAHACHLKLSLTTLGSEVMDCPWSVEVELEAYVLKARHVSPSCRLTMDEELLLLESCTDTDNGAVGLHNRRTMLRGLRDGAREVELRIPACAIAPDFDAIEDRTFVSDGADGALVGAYERVKGKVSDALQSVFGEKRPDGPCMGADAALLLHRALSSDSLNLNSSRGFIFLYELFTGSLDVSILARDAARVKTASSSGPPPPSHDIACVLMRLLPTNECYRKGLLMSILRALASNPSVCTSMPRFEPPQGTVAMLKESPAAKLLKAAHEYLRARVKALRWSNGESMAVGHLRPPPLHVPPTTVQLRRTHEYRLMVCPRAADTKCDVRALHAESPRAVGRSLTVGDDDIEAWAGAPLSSCLPLNEYVDVGQGTLASMVSEGLGALGSAISSQLNSVFEGDGSAVPTTEATTAEHAELSQPSLPFSLRHHPHAVTHVAKQMVARLEADLVHYHHQQAVQIEPRLFCIATDVAAGFAPEAAIHELQRLRGALVAVFARDDAFLRDAIELATTLSDGQHTASASRQRLEETRDSSAARAQLAHNLSVLGGTEPQMTFELLVALSLSSDAREKLVHLNPNLGREDAEIILRLTSVAMMVTCRKSQVMRCLPLITDLGTHLQKLHGLTQEGERERPALLTELNARAASLAAALAARRHFMATSRSEPEDEQGFFSSSQADRGRVVATFDPRFLAFEFMSTLGLRQQQVELIRKFMAGVRGGQSTAPDGRSSCHQM